MTQGHRIERAKGDKTIGRWWLAEEGKKHGEVWATVRRIRELWATRTKLDRHHMELYSNQNVAGLGPNGEGAKRSRVRFNLIAQAINTLAAQIATQRPKPMYLTSEGDFGLQRQARLRTRVLEGQLHDLNAYEIMPRVFIDAAVTGTGFVYGYLDPDTNEPCIERCLPGTVWVDPRDGLRGDPMSIHYRIPVARDAVGELYEVEDRDLESAEGPNPTDKTDLWLTQDSTCDDVMVVFSFRRPTTKKSKDGRLVVSLSSCTLLDMEWNHPLPFVRFAFQERQLGYYGSGVAEAGRDPQARILRSIARHDEAQDRGTTTWCLVPRQANVRTEKLSNAPMTLVHFDGPQPPTIQAFDGAPPGLEEAVDRIREQFFAEMGISAMAAQAEKPAGLDSAPSQRAYQDITSQRQQVPARQFETAYMDLVRLLEMLNARAQKKNSSYSVMARTQRGRATLVKQVKWSEVFLEENKYRLTCWPTSMLPSSPAGRMAMVSDWIASGFISRPNAQQLMLDIPDTDQAARIELADMDCVMADIERILDGYEAYPEPYQDLTMAADIARRSYLNARANDAPEDVLQRLRDYVNDCLEMNGLPRMDAQQLQQGQAAPMGGAAMPPVPPEEPAMVQPTQGQGSPMLM